MSVKLDSRWNRRGIKKCPQCGNYNGQRAVRCSNKSCRHILKEINKQTDCGTSTLNDSFVAVQIKNGDEEKTAELYSVRKINGTEIIRGFVEIRDSLYRVDEQVLQLRTAVCYVGCDLHTELAVNCQHVRAASATTEVAEVMSFNRESLDMLNLSLETRDAIWNQHSIGSADDPLVQKVSPDIFVVKCIDKLQESIPYCHVQLRLQSSIICNSQNGEICKGSSSLNHEYMVAAALISTPKYRPAFEGFIEKLLLAPVKDATQVFKNVSVLDSMVFLQDELSNDLSLQNNDQLLITTVEDPPSVITDSDIQLVDCTLGFDPELGRIDPSQSSVPMSASTSPVIELINSTEDGDSAVDTFVTSYDDTFQLMDCQIELMDQFNSTDRIDFCPSDIELSEDNVIPNGDDELVLGSPAHPGSPEAEGEENNTKCRKKLIEVTAKKAALRKSSKTAKEKMKRSSYSVRKLMRVLESNGIVFNRIKPSQAKRMASEDGECSSPSGFLPSFEATLCDLSFTSWLESVIEQLNSVIVYEGSGKPDTQVFSIHEDYFKCLRARFSVGHCLRMPDHSKEITGGKRRGLSCDIYNFSSYKSLRNVLRTDKILLKFEKSFCRTATGSYDEIDLSPVPSKDSSSSNHGHSSKDRTLTIKAFEYKTYIKMGTRKGCASDTPHHFVIEWIAGVLPISGFGEMRITFEYGHMENSTYVGPPDVSERVP